MNVWPTAQGLFANTLEYLWEFVPVRETGVAAEDREFAASVTQQDNVLRAHVLGKWMASFLVAAWEYSEDDATAIIFPSFHKVHEHTHPQRKRERERQTDGKGGRQDVSSCAHKEASRGSKMDRADPAPYTPTHTRT
jgi:hypothetical protein